MLVFSRMRNSPEVDLDVDTFEGVTAREMTSLLADGANLSSHERRGLDDPPLSLVGGGGKGGRSSVTSRTSLGVRVARERGTSGVDLGKGERK